MSGPRLGARPRGNVRSTETRVTGDGNGGHSMDNDRFDSLIRLARTSRRAAIRAAIASVMAGPLVLLGVARSPGAAAASCLANRHECKRGSQCCSGICQRKRGERTTSCRRSPHQGTCTIEKNACTQGVAAACGTPGRSCYCFVTTRGASFCGKGNGVNSCEECAEQFPGRQCFPGGGPQCESFSCVEPCAG